MWLDATYHKVRVDGRVISQATVVAVGGFVAAKRIGGEIKLFNLSANVLDLFELTKLNVVFDVYESESEAIKSFFIESNKSAFVSPQM